MKLAISGKGGVGKTTLTALLAHHWTHAGREVIAVDADPDANLASALGVPAKEVPTPISEMRQLIQERTGAKGGFGGYFKINPDVDDIPEKFSHLVEGIRLLVLGGVQAGGTGCICPESALLKALVTHLLLRRDQMVLLDMEAGIEHLGRATAGAVSAMVVVVEPGLRSIQTAKNVSRLAADIGIKHVGVVFNRVPEGVDISELTGQLEQLTLLGRIPYDQQIARADFVGRSVWPPSEPVARCVEQIAAELDKLT